MSPARVVPFANTVRTDPRKTLAGQGARNGNAKQKRRSSQ